MSGAQEQPAMTTHQVKKLSFELILLVLLFSLCLSALFIVAKMVFTTKDMRFDDRVFSIMAPYITDSRTEVVEFITYFGSANFLLPANLALVAIFLFIKKNRTYSIKIAAVSITSTAVMFLLKVILHRQRPLLPVVAKVHGYSFPSGHSFSSFVFFGMLAYIGYKTIRRPWLKWLTVFCCFVFVLMIGLSRIYLKVHYASDVIAGFCLGTIWLLLAKWLLFKTQPLETTFR